jgi:hypothetical protein
MKSKSLPTPRSQRETTSPLSILDAKLKIKTAPALTTPDSKMSFHTWLNTYAKVRQGNTYVPYSITGREPLYAVILVIDFVLGNDCSYATPEERESILGTAHYGEIISDAQLDICGGAQFGKTILALLFKTYMGTVKFRHTMYCLPDDDLVQGIIDTKERPDVIDQINYVGNMLQIGKTLTESGKAANRKGAMLYTDGIHNAVSMMRGLGKFPTSFTADAVCVDEYDDVKEMYADYLPGRLTTSDLRFIINIGTQRYHGAGQNALYEDGSQHVGHLTCPACKRDHVPEEEWPQICRMSVTGKRSVRDPVLDNSGKFVSVSIPLLNPKSESSNSSTSIPLSNLKSEISNSSTTPVAHYHPEFDYYFACVSCGAQLDRTNIVYRSRQPDRIAARHWSIRVSQMSCSGLPVQMFASDWCTKAVRKTNQRIAFNCDRLAIPRSTGQKLSPGILERAGRLAPYSLALSPGTAPHRFAGLDTGDQCWFVCRDADGERRRLLWCESIADSDTRSRAVALFQTLELDCLFVDAGPLRDLARELAMSLNNLNAIDINTIRDWEKARIRFPGGVTWNGELGLWENLRCAPVEFSAKPGSGILQQARLTPDNKHIYPVISCNRDEAIQGVIDDLLTAEDGLAVIDATGNLRTDPVYLLPNTAPDPAVLDTYRKHVLAGSVKVRDTDGREEHFVDSVPNHFLLATTYARLAEQFRGAGRTIAPPMKPIAFTGRRSVALESRRERMVIA